MSLQGNLCSPFEYILAEYRVFYIFILQHNNQHVVFINYGGTSFSRRAFFSQMKGLINFIV